MQQPTTRQLFAYWDKVRNGRIAPRRFEIEPAKIAGLLPETFIAEGAGLLGIRFRLAGTKICEHFGRELRGMDFLNLWSTDDRDAVTSLARNVFADAAVGYGTFRAHTETSRQVDFEILLLPLIHRGRSINRLLGAITAIEPPFWLGAEPLTRQEIVELHLHWPEGIPAFVAHGAKTQGLTRRRFRVVEGGRAEGE
ncbi:MAG: PAS domain-containing protein [Methyloceanibacter sp.]